MESRGEGRFYVNVGVLFDDMFRLRGAEPPALPKYGDCDFMVRWENLNPQLPPSIKVDETTQPEVLSAWLSQQIEQFVVVPLNSVSSTHDFGRTGWVSAIPWGFPAKFHFLLGEIKEARRLVQLEASAFADRGCTFESVAKSLHLAFSD